MKRPHPPPDIDIEPIPFSPDRASAKSPWIGWSARVKWITVTGIGLMFLCLVFGAWFVFTAKQVIIDITPTPERVWVEGGIFSPRLGEYYLLRPGQYRVHAEKSGYRRLDEQLQVTDQHHRTLNFSLQKLPGEITFTAHQEARPDVAISGATVYVDGNAIGKTPIQAALVEAGRRQIRIQADNYKVVEMTLDVKGMGEVQSLDVALVHDWAQVTIRSDPGGAAVYIDGQPKGKTPLDIRLPEGDYELQLRAARFNPVTMRLSVIAGRPQVLDTVHLTPQDGILSLQTSPKGANVTVDDTYAGQTPLEIPLPPDRDHVVRMSKTGYAPVRRKFRLAAAERHAANVTLPPRKGTIHLSVDPPDAALYIDGIRRDPIPERLEMIAVEHRIDIKKKGYTPYGVRITPRPGFPQKLNIVLNPIRPRKKTLSAVIKAVNGYALRLVRPKPFVMGSSRREQGRRSNESLRNIVLKRAFYMGTREVTNKELRAFLSRHDSGSFSAESLNRYDQAVVRVTWKQAVRFCNWLSVQEGLAPVYAVEGDRVTAADPPGTGYRLPTEAEWEYCARVQKDGSLKKYPWGDRFPPEDRTANIADASAKDLLSETVVSYNDGYPVTAPPGAFDANDLGLHDLGGNVAEWCHDYYTIYPHSTQKVSTDPSGPAQGKHRVVRGSSWRHASISALRAAYRDYSNTQRPDLGFRICRYAE